MNSLRSNSISYLVAQPKVETRYNQKNLHAFLPFRAECRHACRLEFLAVIFLRVMFVIARNAASWLAPSLKQYVKIERRKIEILFNIHY
jgi:hypothetical protein